MQASGLDWYRACALGPQKLWWAEEAYVEGCRSHADKQRQALCRPQA